MRELKLTLFCWQSTERNVLRQHGDIENDGLPGQLQDSFEANVTGNDVIPICNALDHLKRKNPEKAAGYQVDFTGKQAVRIGTADEV